MKTETIQRILFFMAYGALVPVAYEIVEIKTKMALKAGEGNSCESCSSFVKPCWKKTNSEDPNGGGVELRGDTFFPVFPFFEYTTGANLLCSGFSSYRRINQASGFSVVVAGLDENDPCLPVNAGSQFDCGFSWKCETVGEECIEK
jgi:hypothetical protein